MTFVTDPRAAFYCITSRADKIGLSANCLRCSTQFHELGSLVSASWSIPPSALVPSPMNTESFKSVSREVYGKFVEDDERVASDGRPQADHLCVLIHG